MNVVIDTSAWIEYLSDGRYADEIESIIQDPDSAILVPAIVLAEIRSVVERKVGRDDAEKAVDYIRENFPVLELTEDLAVRAGELHAELRRKQKDISLADCIIMAHVERIHARVITLDRHFRLWEGSVVLGD